MQATAKGMVLAAFAADSLSLGAHWIYDADRIVERFGRVEHLFKPLKDGYHPTKDRGELTHYGDQTLRLLHVLAENSAFDLNRFAAGWRALFENYSGYIDKATRQTLANFKDGKTPAESGSTSSELGGASRIAPLVYLYRNDLDRLIDSVRAQTTMTHNHPAVIDSAEFFARTAWKVLRKTSPAQAVQTVATENFDRPPFDKWISEGVASAARETRAAIAGFGQMCEVEAGFPAVVHLLVRYQDRPREALVENVMAGGDSAARGMLTGMILGAALGMSAIADDWLADLKSRDEILGLLDRIDPESGAP